MENKFGKLSRLHLVAVKKNQKTILEEVAFTAPFKIMRPYYEKKDTMTVMQQTASAGIMAGDRQEIDITVLSGAKMELVSQAFEKIHKMNEGFAERKTLIHVSADSSLRYMPLPVIPFSGSDFRSEQTVYLEDDTAKFIFQEVISCGRVAHGEQFGYKAYKNRISIYKKNHLVYLDNTNFTPCNLKMDGYGMYEGYTHLASMIIVNHVVDDGTIGRIRSILDEEEGAEGGVTLTASGDLVIRILGRSADQLMKLMTNISID